MMYGVIILKRKYSGITEQVISSFLRDINLTVDIEYLGCKTLNLLFKPKFTHQFCVISGILLLINTR